MLQRSLGRIVDWQWCVLFLIGPQVVAIVLLVIIHQFSGKHWLHLEGNYFYIWNMSDLLNHIILLCTTKTESNVFSFKNNKACNTLILCLYRLIIFFQILRNEKYNICILKIHQQSQSLMYLLNTRLLNIQGDDGKHNGNTSFLMLLLLETGDSKPGAQLMKQDCRCGLELSWLIKTPKQCQCAFLSSINWCEQCLSKHRSQKIYNQRLLICI